MRFPFYLFLFIFSAASLALFQCGNPKTVDSVAALTVYPKNLKALKQTELPESILFKGQFLEAKKWIDTNGENFLVVSNSGVKKGSTEFNTNTKSVEYYAVQYVQKEGKLTKLWDLFDFEKDCEFDLWIGTLGVYVSDLDSNGTTETKIAYKKSCRSDVSPAQLRIMMYEGTSKMALRGLMLLKPIDSSFSLANFEPDLSKLPKSSKDKSEDYERLFGRFENANDFADKPKIMLLNAIDVWKSLIQQDDFKQF
jgi:hypothetical protein